MQRKQQSTISSPSCAVCSHRAAEPALELFWVNPVQGNDIKTHAPISNTFTQLLNTRTVLGVNKLPEVPLLFAKLFFFQVLSENNQQMLKRRSTFSITKINLIWKFWTCDTHCSPANKPARDDIICIFNLLTVLMILGEADTSPVSTESKHPLPAELFPGYRNEPLGFQGCNNTRHCKAPEETWAVTKGQQTQSTWVLSWEQE